MSNSMGREYQGTYVILERNSQEERERLDIQDQAITRGMGGVWPEQPHSATFHHVLDIGCGPGFWLLEAARTYPDIETLIGIDVSSAMLTYARQQAQQQQIATRVEFALMDALLLLEFPDNFFDLVNLRFGVSWLRTWDWPKMLSEMQRVCRPGGIIRLVDVDLTPKSASPALDRHFASWVQVLAQRGHLFDPSSTGLTAHLSELLTRHGVQAVQSQHGALTFHAGTPEGQVYTDNLEHIFHTGHAFLAKHGCLPQEHEALYRQAHHDMQQPDFAVTLNLLTVWGIPARSKSTPIRD